MTPDTNPSPLALTFNIDLTSPKGAALRALLDGAGVAVRPVGPEELDQSVGHLAGLPGFSPCPADAPAGTPAPASDPLPTEEFLLLCNMEEDQVMAVIRAMRPAGVAIGCKAALTEHNRRWAFGDLVREVSAEHAAMARYRAQQQ